jgi:hypothetical protein
MEHLAALLRELADRVDAHTVKDTDITVGLCDFNQNAVWFRVTMPRDEYHRVVERALA